jgi:O-antigen/teichoic acid export membrane protein
LGAAEYGVFSYALGLAGFFTIFADVGVSQILTREASQKPAERTRYFATAFWIKAVLLTLTALAIVILAPHFSTLSAANALIPFVALLAIFDGVREFSLSFLRALERMEIEAFITVLMNVMITAAGFVALWVSASAYSVMFAYVASTGAGAVAAVVVLKNLYRQVVPQFERTLVKPILGASFPFAILGILGAFLLNIDMVMLGWWVGAADIGFYSAGQKVIQVLYTIPAILASALFPAIARLVGEGTHEKVRTLMERGITASLLIAFPLTVGGIVLAPPIMELVYGAEYLPAAAAFQFLSVTLLLVFSGSLIGNLVLAYDEQRRIGWFVAAGAGVNVILNILLIPRFGIAGCAAATIVAQLVNNGLMWRMIKKKCDFRTARQLFRIVPASIVMGGVAWFLNAAELHVLATIVLAAGAYFAALWLFKEPLLRDLAALKRALKLATE